MLGWIFLERPESWWKSNFDPSSSSCACWGSSINFLDKLSERAEAVLHFIRGNLVSKPCGSAWKWWFLSGASRKVTHFPWSPFWRFVEIFSEAAHAPHMLTEHEDGLWSDNFWRWLKYYLKACWSTFFLKLFLRFGAGKKRADKRFCGLGLRRFALYAPAISVFVA